MRPTERTLAELRSRGLLCDVVERFIKRGKLHGIRRDLFNIIDVIALDPERGIIGVQCFGASGMTEHRTKILDEHQDKTRMWLACTGKLELWGWRKVKLKRGGKAIRWQPRIEEITLEDLTPQSAQDRHHDAEACDKEALNTRRQSAREFLRKRAV